MATKHSGSETFLFGILLLVCLILTLVYYTWYGATANSASATQTSIAMSLFTPTVDSVSATVAAALKGTATSQTATAAAQPTITPTDTPLPLRDQLWEIIISEADASKHADVQKALSLYAPDAEIIDAASQTKWVGLNQVRSRYVDTFNHYQFLDNVDKFIDLKQDSEISATVRVTQTGTVLDLNGGTPTPFPTPPNRESWQFVKLDDGWKIRVFTYFIPTYYTVKNFHSQLCLEAYTNPAVVQNYCTGAPNQHWQFSPTDDKNFQPIVNSNGKCMDIDGNAGEADGIILRNCNSGSETQLWRLELYGSYITIVSKHHDPNKPEILEFCVDPQQFSTRPTEQMIFYDCNQKHNGQDNANQLWLATEVQ